MPQITLQYTDNVHQGTAFSELFLDIHKIVSEVGGVRIGNCKSRAIRLEDYFVSAGDNRSGFVHLDLAILEGRSEVKHELGQLCLDKLKSHFASDDEAIDLQITVEIRDMRRTAYFKYPDGTLTPI